LKTGANDGLVTYRVHHWLDISGDRPTYFDFQPKFRLCW